MEEEHEKKYHEIEENHWWFTSRREMIKILLEDFPKDSEILDVGCSGGVLLKELKKEGFRNIIGIDISEKAIDLCKKNGLKNLYVMDGGDLKFRNKFDLIIASDVLEHIENDKKVVESWKKALKKGGKVICFVPALDQLKSNHDVVNRHHRRYHKRQLRELFRREGFEILRQSYWNNTLFLPILFVRTIERILPSKMEKESQLNDLGQPASFLFRSILGIENRLHRIFNSPLGVSLFVVAKK